MARIPWNKGITKYKPMACLCGCGELVQVHRYKGCGNKDGGYTYVVNNFIKPHAKRGVGGFNPILQKPHLCKCGCGIETKKFHGHYNFFIKGHGNRGRIAWNKGKGFSALSRKKMSLARLGKEPSNKIRVDVAGLHKLYVVLQKSMDETAGILNISSDVVKNRLQSLGWSRSTKATCSLPEFREKMRIIRIKALTSSKVLQSPNKLEQLVYRTLDQLGVEYEKQVPLFNKFVVDALFPRQKLVLEIFGRYWHELPVNLKKDFSKKKYLEKCGYKVEEVWDYEIKKDGAFLPLQNILKKHNLYST